MRRQAVEQLSSVIRANTERRSLDELRAQGKRHVRVVSGEKVMRLIQAIVDDTIEREAGELASKDRDRIVSDSRQEFDRVLKIQSEQEAETRRYRELEAHHRDRADLAEERVKLLTERLEESHEQVHDAETRLARLEAYLAEARQQYEAGETERVRARKITENALERCLNAEAKLESVEARLNTASGTIANFDQEFERLASERESARLELAAAQEGHTVRERALAADIQRLEAELMGRDEELTILRTQETPQQLSELRGEVEKMRNVVLTLADRPAGTDASALEALVERISERESVRASEMEERFGLQMERAIDEVARTLKSATAKPVEVTVEATDVLVDRIFDHEDEMRTNLDSLAVEELSSKREISRNLARLKRTKASRGGDK